MKQEKQVGKFLEENIEGIHEVMAQVIPYLIEVKENEGAAKAYEFVKNKVDKALTDSKLFDHATCSFGCSFCCHDTLYLSGDEGDRIKQVVADKGIIPNAERIVKQKSSDEVKWIDKACPLLQDEDEDGNRLCSIYEDRPLICRVHNSREDPAKCNKEDDPNREIQELKMVALDAMLMSSYYVGSKEVINGEPQVVKLHELW